MVEMGRVCMHVYMCALVCTHSMNNPPQAIATAGSRPPSWRQNSNVLQASIIEEAELVGRISNPCPTVNTCKGKKTTSACSCSVKEE